MSIKRLGDAILFLGREDHREAWQASTVEDLSRVLDRYGLDCALVNASSSRTVNVFRGNEELFAAVEADLGGELGRIFAVRGNFGEDYLFTLDGLYIANLFRDCRAAPEAYPSEAVRGAVLKDVSVFGEPFGGCLFQDPDTGKVYVTGGDGSASIFEIRGLDTVRRLPVTEVVLTEAH